MTRASIADGKPDGRSPATPPACECVAGWCVFLLLALYATGLTQRLTAPWSGMHDWNGAFYSQLARNLLRYPFDVHHGMGVLAVGADAPPANERGLYAHHPPGMVWLTAAAFRIAGESEATARTVPIAASLASLWMLVALTARRWGRDRALCAGFVFAMMPMSVYFGRMVNHEAVCLCLMLAAVLAWQSAAPERPAKTSVFALTGWGAAIAAMIWIDWIGVLFAGLFCAYLTFHRRRQGLTGGRLFYAWGVSIGAAAGMVCYLVYGGLDGNWEKLWSIFVSRRENNITPSHSVAWEHVLGNLSWPILALAVFGAAGHIAGRASRQTQVYNGPSHHSGRPVGGLGVIALTGLIWVVLFWRLFKIHNYWMFYLGPWVALSAAAALAGIRSFAFARAPMPAWALFYTTVVIAGAAALNGTQRYFAKTFLPERTITAWRDVNQLTRPDERIVLQWDPIQFDRYGAFAFRTIVPPQLAYYLDRAFDVRTDASHAVALGAPANAMYVVPQQAVLANPESFKAVGSLPATPAGDLLLIRLGGRSVAPTANDK